jgi:hypothetical protein
MNNQEKYKEDLLRQYIGPERIEKAPEGFTSKVMTRVHLETQPLAVSGRSVKTYTIPLISAAVTILLIAAALLFSGNQSDTSAFALLKHIKISLPELNLSSLFRFTLPSVLVYVLIGILILTVFDTALYGIFHRENSPKS